MSINRGMEKGDTFASFEEFQETLVSYQNQSGQKFTRTNSKTLKKYWNNGVVKDLTLHGYKPELVYFQAAYECVYSSKNTSRNKHKKTTNCSAKILLGVKDKQFLIVKTYDATHDHLDPQTISVSNSDAASIDKETPFAEDQGTAEKEKKIDAPEIEQILRDLKENLYSSSANVMAEKIGQLKTILQSWQNKTSSSLSTNEFDLVDASGTLLGTLSLPICDLATESTDLPLNEYLTKSNDKNKLTNNANNLAVSDEAAFAAFRPELVSDEAHPIDSNGNTQEPASISLSQSAWLDISFNETGDMSSILRAIDSSHLNGEKVRTENITSLRDGESGTFENVNSLDPSTHDSQDVGQETECSIPESAELQTSNHDVRDDNDFPFAESTSGYDAHRKIRTGNITSPRDQTSDIFESMNFVHPSTHGSQHLDLQETECSIPESAEQTSSQDVKGDNDFSVAKSSSGYDENGNSSCSNDGENIYPHDSNDDENNNTASKNSKSATELKAPVKYSLKTNAQKIETMLRWLGIDDEVLENVLNLKYRISKRHFHQSNPKALKDSLIDEDVRISLLKKYFEATAFKDLRSILRSKADLNIWTCGQCRRKIVGSCVRCDSCLIWYHLKCASLALESTKLDWFCEICRDTENTARK